MIESIICAVVGIELARRYLATQKKQTTNVTTVDPNAIAESVLQAFNGAMGGGGDITEEEVAEND